MPKSTLTWYKTDSKNIVNGLRLLEQKEIAHEIGTTQQNVSYSFTSGRFQKLFEVALRLIRLAGYEVIRREEE